MSVYLIGTPHRSLQALVQESKMPHHHKELWHRIIHVLEEEAIRSMLTLIREDKRHLDSFTQYLLRQLQKMPENQDLAEQA